MLLKMLLWAHKQLEEKVVYPDIPNLLTGELSAAQQLKLVWWSMAVHQVALLAQSASSGVFGLIFGAACACTVAALV